MSQLENSSVISAARQLFAWAYHQGRLSKLKTVLTRKSRKLYEMETIRKSCKIEQHHEAGLQTIPLRQIRGTETRTRDFDINFYPRHTHNRERWINVAAALKSGKQLPPVKLVQVENIYLVQDGHHRISIARALGREYIDALVVRVDVGDRLPGVNRPPHSSCLNK